MIIDHLDNSKLYESIHPLFEKAFNYLESVDFMTVDPGKVELQDSDLFAIISDSELKLEEEANIEVHNKYIDIQLPISKQENFGWHSRNTLNMPIGPFDTEKDIQFFEDKASFIFSLPKRNFVVFFPEDGHAPCIGEGMIRKVVVKIKL